MHICFVTNKYPNKFEPNILVFLQQLVVATAKNGVKCSVICPVPVNLNKNYKQLPEYTVEKYDEAEVSVYFPRYFGLGQTNIGPFNPAVFTTARFTKAVESVIKKWDGKPDAFYGHFVTPAGIAAARLGRTFSVPSFLAFGEASLNMINHFGQKGVKRELASLTGVVAVSSQNKDMIAPFVKEGITEIFPNAIDNSVFYPRNRAECRKKWGIDDDKFVISFVGSLDTRKGINRLSDAIDKLDDDNIVLLCAGKGSLKPETKRCKYCGPVLHSELPELLSASDVFVLPTQHEGCCNAIVEALACGLPIISSDLSFNYDILDESNAILIDPDDVSAIAESIKKIKNDSDLRNKLASGSVARSKRLTLPQRASNIVSFIESSIQNIR